MPSIVYTSLDDFVAGVRRALAVAADPSEVRVITPGSIPALEVSDAVADALVASADDTAPSPEVPDRNDSTAVWAHYMHTVHGIDTDGLKRADLMAKYDEITGADTAE